MKQPMLWTFIMMTAFVLLFFVGTVQIQGVSSSIFQMIGFGGMVFTMLYGLLVTQHTESENQEKQEE
ncbi:hypothetical protein SAMN05192534_10829 [Alteribacillus persepolensis]|uniref:Uncharacterized protein n=1 Tax=Alteribacillus persepolensis TaxID=568899 RepID=A0A1G8DUA3_9BACI|nr:hypothetical protein [Alteribacillus persepolensis]SDH61253.1 hypothetical protein SAMN05192534_10829 [Alteribacillus persepolensis]